MNALATGFTEEMERSRHKKYDFLSNKPKTYGPNKSKSTTDKQAGHQKAMTKVDIHIIRWELTNLVSFKLLHRSLGFIVYTVLRD